MKPPVVPGNFCAAGLNYRAHIEWANQAHGSTYKVSERADIGYRSNNALDHVRGYTLGNDISERTWQRSDRTLWRAKNSDTCKPSRISSRACRATSPCIRTT